MIPVKKDGVVIRVVALAIVAAARRKRETGFQKSTLQDGPSSKSMDSKNVTNILLNVPDMDKPDLVIQVSGRDITGKVEINQN